VTDLEALTIHCQARYNGDEEGEISDGAARTIASLYHDGSAAALAFASTGAITTDELWGHFFGNYSYSSPAERTIANMLGTYLLNRKDRGPVEGWSSLSDPLMKGPLMDEHHCYADERGETCYGADENCRPLSPMQHDTPQPTSGHKLILVESADYGSVLEAIRDTQAHAWEAHFDGFGHLILDSYFG
jgi:hypothetical protein